MNADFATTAPWAGIQSKPEAFPPAPHRHIVSDLERSGAEAGEVLTFNGRRWEPQRPSWRDLIVEAGMATATLKEELTLIADGQRALAEKTTTLEAKFGGSEASIRETISALAEANKAMATATREISVRLGEASAKIRRVDEVIVTRDTALARVTEEIGAQIAGNSASITTIKSSYATRSFAESKKSEAIVAAAVDATAKVSTEETARTSADGALATRALALETTVNNGTTGVVATYARVTTEETARASADGALASSISTVVASVGAKVKVQATAPTVPAPALNDVWIDTTDNNKAKYWSGSAWLYKQDGVLYAAITDESTVRATKDGYLSGMRVIGVDVGGRVTGMKITAISDPTGWTSTSEVAFNAGVFKIYNGTSDIAPFTVAGGVVYLTNAVAETLKASISISSPVISGGTITGAALIINSGLGLRYYTDTGVYTITGGTANGIQYGAQIDMMGTSYGGYGLGGTLVLQAGNGTYGNIIFRTGYGGTSGGADYGLDRFVVNRAGEVYSSGAGAARVGFIDAASAGSYNTYVGLRYDATNSRAELAALTAGIAWRDVYIGKNARLIADNLTFGTHADIGSETLTGYMLVKDSAGTTRKLAVIS